MYTALHTTNQSQCYRAKSAIWDHTVLLAT